VSAFSSFGSLNSCKASPESSNRIPLNLTLE
jgi:hypothetical protein